MRSSAESRAELALLLVQFLLPAREIPDPVERVPAALPLVGTFLDLRPLFVVGPLLPLQLLVEQRRQVLPERLPPPPPDHWPAA